MKSIQCLLDCSRKLIRFQMHLRMYGICTKLRGATQDQKKADLPIHRVNPTPPFTYAAVDYFGPWIVKERRGS